LLCRFIRNYCGSSFPTNLRLYTNSNGAVIPTERIRISSSGQILIGAGAIAAPKASVGGLDVSSGLYSIVMGGEANTGDGTPRANSAQKEARLCMPHYTNAQEPAALVYGVTLSGENRLNLGGGSSLLNAATSIKFYTGVDTTTTSGSERLRINEYGSFGISGANYGSSGQVIKSAGSGTAPAWGPMAFSSFAVICDKKGSNDDGGTATAGNYAVYDVRNLNYELADPDSIVSISSNQFTLVAGTYWVEWKVPAYAVDMFTAELINVTDGTGNRGSAPGKCNTDSVTYCHGSSYFTISASKTFEIRQHSQTSRSGNGLGVRAGYSNSSVNETFYTFVYIYKK